MKRWIITAALLMFTVGTLVGCAKKVEEAEPEAEVEAVAEETAAATPPAPPADHPAH